MDIKAADIDFKIDFINNGSLKNTGYKIRVSKNTVFLENVKTTGQSEIIFHSKKEVYKFLYRFDSFLMFVNRGNIDKNHIFTIFKMCD